MLALRNTLSGGQRDLETLERADRSSRHYFINGLVTNVLNPKVALFYLAFLPQFIRPDDPVFLHSVVLGSIHLLFSLTWLVSIALLVGRMRGLLTRPTARRIMGTVTGTILVGLGVRLALEHR